MNDILKVIRNERHDFLNHLQVISGLLQLKKHDKVLEYVGKVTKEIYSLGKVTRITDYCIATTLLLMNYEAHQKGINFQIEVLTELDELKIESEKFGNGLQLLLRSSFELCQVPNTRESTCLDLSISEEEKKYIFELSCSNVGSDENREKVLEAVALLNQIPDVNAKFFDTNKKSRVYISLPKRECNTFSVNG